MRRHISKRGRFLIPVTVLSLLASLAEARVTRIEITTREHGGSAPQVKNKAVRPTVET